jgi:hypothetical protein
MKYLRATAADYRRIIILCIIILPVLLMIVSYHHAGDSGLQDTFTDQPTTEASPGLADMLLKK